MTRPEPPRHIPWAHLAAAAAALVAVAVVSRLHWQPVATHTLVTSLVLLAAAALIVPRGSPHLLPPGRTLSTWGPGITGVLLVAGAAALYFGLLGGDRSGTVTVQGLLLVALVPVAEEAFFRGTLLRLIPHLWLPAALISSAAFGLLHLQLGWPQVLLMSAVGCGLAALALWSRSVALPVVAHAAFNGLAAAYQERAPIYLVIPVLLALCLSLIGGLVRRDPA